MKYIISESRLDNLIQKYLSSKLSGLKIVEKRDSYDELLDVYVDKSGEPLVIIYPKGLLALNRRVYDSLENIFGLETTDDIQAQLTKYFTEKWGLPVETVYTFNDWDNL
jgi:hypothetical protein